ncbi:MAG: MBOAT family O-acyltransferase [Lachnospiraceae bacterium]|nr:MBOAT family O-acyltransferase [Lachnospiraceae bacterium]
MVFNSFPFLFAYLPVVLIAFWVSRRYLETKWADLCLIVASLIFYGWNYPKCLPVLLGSLIVNYVWGCLLYKDLTKEPKTTKKKIAGKTVEKTGSELNNSVRKRKCILGAGIVLNVAVLCFFKYARLLPAFQGMEVDAPGISFFTFTQIAFLVETYRGNIVPMGMREYGLYVSFFPKLMQGPIMLPEDFQAQRGDEKATEEHKKRTRAVFKNFALRSTQTKDEWWEKLLRNVILISLGLFKKVILADTLGQAVATGFENVSALNAIDAWVVMLSYTLQLYFDFSGYCDIAMGVAAFFGYDLPLNFDSPYKAVNIMDFWKRWHKTLTDFLTKYVYIPLGGNRKGTFRMYVNFLIVFFVSGIWHGAGWQFVVWGMMHGVLYVITRAVSGRGKDNNVRTEADSGRIHRMLRGLSHGVCVLLTFLYVNVAWVFFRASSVKEGVRFLHRLVRGGAGKVSRTIAEAFNLDEFWYVIKVFHLDRSSNSYFYVMVLFLIVCLLLIWVTPNAVQIAKKCKLNVGMILLAAVLFVWSVISFSGVSTFLYFNF